MTVPGAANSYKQFFIDLSKESQTVAKKRGDKNFTVGDIAFVVEQLKPENYPPELASFVKNPHDDIGKMIYDLTKLYEKASKLRTPEDVDLANFGRTLKPLVADFGTRIRTVVALSQNRFAGKTGRLENLKTIISEFFSSIRRLLKREPQEKIKEFTQQLATWEKEFDQKIRGKTTDSQGLLDLIDKFIDDFNKHTPLTGPVKDRFTSELHDFKKCFSETLLSEAPTKPGVTSSTELPKMQDVASSLELCKKAAESCGKENLQKMYEQYAKNPDEKTLVQVLYEFGKGIKNNDALAFSCCKAASDAKNPKALYFMARMTELGLGTNKDSQEASKLYQQAASALEKASKTDPEAEFLLGIMCENGKGLQKDHTMAVSHMKNAAEKGNLGATFFYKQHLDRKKVVLGDELRDLKTKHPSDEKIARLTDMESSIISERNNLLEKNESLLTNPEEITGSAESFLSFRLYPKNDFFLLRSGVRAAKERDAGNANTAWLAVRSGGFNRPFALQKAIDLGDPDVVAEAVESLLLEKTTGSNQKALDLLKKCEESDCASSLFLKALEYLLEEVKKARTDWEEIEILGQVSSMSFLPESTKAKFIELLQKAAYAGSENAFGELEVLQEVKKGTKMEEEMQFAIKTYDLYRSGYII